MRIESTKSSQSLLLFLCFLGLSLFTGACSSSSDECGSGYHLEEGSYVPDRD